MIEAQVFSGMSTAMKILYSGGVKAKNEKGRNKGPVGLSRQVIQIG